jgi:hypothetical protein
MILVMSGLSERVETGRSGPEAPCACCGHPCRFHEHGSYEEWRESEFIYSFYTKSQY